MTGIYIIVFKNYCKFKKKFPLGIYITRIKISTSFEVFMTKKPDK